MFKNVSNAAGTFISKMFLQIGVFVIFAQTLNQSDFGLISLAFTMSWAIMNIADFGFRTKIVKDVSSQPNVECINSVLYNSDPIKIVLFILMALFSFIYTYFMDFTADGNMVVLIYVFSALFLLLANGRFAVLQALGKFNIEFKVNLISVIFYSILITIAVLNDADMIFFALSYLFYSIFCFMWSLRYVNNVTNYSNFNAKEVYIEAKLALPFAIMVIANVLLVTLDIFMLQAFYDLESVAIYQVFSRINVGMLIFFNILYSVFLPKINQLLQEGNFQQIKQYKVMVSVIGIVLAVIYFLLDYYLLPVLFGEEYEVLSNWGWVVSLICIVKYSFWFMTELILISTGNQKKRLKAYIYGLLISLVVYLFLISNYSWEGAIVSSLFSTLCIATMYGLISRKEMNFKLDR